MLIALYDYINYRNKRGIYSRISLESEGGKLAAPNLSPLLEEARPMDTMIYHGSNSILSWVVMYFTKSAWSHVACFGENGYLYDATTQGVIKHHYSDYLDGNGYIVLMRPKEPITQENIQKAIQFGEANIGTPFSWTKVIYLGFLIFVGRHHNYHYRISLDFLIFCSLFLPLGFLSPFFAYTVFGIMICYCVVVLTNRPRRIADVKNLFPKDSPFEPR